MKGWLWVGVLAVAGAWLAHWAMREQGYVAVQFAGWLIETSLSALVLFTLLAGLLGYGLLRLWLTVWRLPSRWRQWRLQKRMQMPVDRMNASVQALALTDEDSALSALVSGKDASQWLRILLAAQLAHAQGNLAMRDQLLAQAEKLAPEEGFIIGLLKARWLLHEAPEQVLSLVDALLVAHPKQRSLKRLRVEALAVLQDWQKLAVCLPAAKSALPRGQFLALQQQLQVAQLLEANSLASLEAQWQQMSRQQQRQGEVVAAYVRQAMQFQPVNEQYWHLLSKSIEQRWQASLLPLLAHVAGNEPYQELKQVEKWLKQHPQEPGLWWLAGVLANKLGLVGQAQYHFEQSMRIQPSAAAALALSDSLTQQGQTEAGRQVLSQLLAQPSSFDRFQPLPQIQQAG